MFTEVIQCMDCKYFSCTTIGMPYACWKEYEIINKYGEDQEHVIARRIDSPEHYCSYAVKRD